MVPWRDFLFVFFRSGNLTLGGGAPMIADLQRRVIADRRWLPPEDFGLLYGIARLTPGTNILAFITAMATRIKGWQGGLAALLAASLPSGIVIYLMTIFFEAWSGNRWVAAGLAGALAAVVGLILASAWQLVQPFRTSWLAWFLAMGALAAGAANIASPLTILLCAAILGAVTARE